jgi:adenine-specific DNA methylase
MTKSFIEVQFPVSKVSKESYKERKANYSQTLTGLGKWWGRKPLILVRAAIIGLLMPASNDPVKDREIFLKILTMDEEGLWKRKSKNITQKELYQRLTPRERQQWFEPQSTEDKPKLKRGLSPVEKQKLQRLVFNRMTYDEKLTYCDRPEQIEGPSEQAWKEINAHLGTKAKGLPDLVQQLGERRFGHIPRVGDAFCGGGSVPFEAARLGCEAYGSDLNPVAALLTWAALNIAGGGPEVAEEVRRAQQEVYAAVDRQITEWGIEHNELGWRADAYLYCNEVICPECGWKVPLAPSWVIGEKTKCVAKLVPDETNRRFEIIIESGVSEVEMRAAKEAGTVKNSDLVCPNSNCRKSTPITMLRGDRRSGGGTQYGLRLWENEDIVPRPDDVFQERLYCIRWVETYIDEEGREQTRRHYMAPDENDMQRERRVLELLSDRFQEWQEKGYIPSKRIEPGDETTRLMRERGWSYWHHLFNPRNLLLIGYFMENISTNNLKPIQKIGSILSLGRCLNYNSRLSTWHSNSANEKVERVFTNQSLNTLFNFASRTLLSNDTSFLPNWKGITLKSKALVIPNDAREIKMRFDIWLTDPPYADAINYHELSEFFLAWYEKHIPGLFPGWYVDSKRALAITGTDESFRKSMVECYRNLANHMPDNGMQIVMFTHQDAGVWADLALILWAAGLRVTAAWCVATETDSALKEGNYVQGTVLLVLRKQTSDETAFFDELYPEVEEEVKKQLNEMLALDDKEDPNFSDTDYQLAAYAAALRVLTKYRNIEDIDVARELSRHRQQGERSPVEDIIIQAVKIACDHLVPQGIDTFIWKGLTPEERFYLKGLDMESRGEYRSGAYQELARGFGIREYRSLLASGRANQTRLKTASEFASRLLGDTGFGASLVRHVLFAVREAVRTGETVTSRNWFRNELGENYWSQRKTIIDILNYLASMGQNKNMPQWQEDANAARLLAGAVENDHI